MKSVTQSRAEFAEGSLVILGPQGGGKGQEGSCVAEMGCALHTQSNCTDAEKLIQGCCQMSEQLPH